MSTKERSQLVVADLPMFDERVVQGWHEVLEAEALRYLRDESLPPVAQGGYTLALAIVRRTLLEGLRDNPSVPHDKKEVMTVLREGFGLRKKLVETGWSWQKRIKHEPTLLSDLGLTKADLDPVDRELERYPVELWPETTNRFIKKATLRAESLKELSVKAFSTHWKMMNDHGVEIDQAKVNTLLAKTKNQALLIRQVLLAYIGEEVGLEIPTLYTTPESLEKMVVAMDEMRNWPSDWQNRVVHKMLLFSDNLQQNSEGENLIRAHLRLLLVKMSLWRGIVSKEKLTSNNKAYWQKMQTMFENTLPLGPLLAGQDYVVDPKQVAMAVSQVKPHLWVNEVKIERFGIPSRRDIAMARQAFSIWRDDRHSQLGLRFSQAEDAWEEWEVTTTNLPKRLEHVMKSIAKLEGFVTENLPKEIDEVHKRLGEVSAIVGRKRQKLTYLSEQTKRQKKLVAEQTSRRLSEVELMSIVPETERAQIDTYCQDIQTLDRLQALVALGRRLRRPDINLTSKDQFMAIAEEIKAHFALTKPQYYHFIENWLSLMDHPLMPWNFNKPVTKSELMKALNHRVAVVRAYLEVPTLQVEVSNLIEERRRLKKALKAQEKARELGRLLQRKNEFVLAISQADKVLLTKMEEIGLVREIW